MLDWFKKNKKEEKAVEVPNSDSALTTEIKTNSEIATIKPSTEENVATVEKTESPKPEPVQPPPLGYKEMRALKKSRYEEDILDNPKCIKSFILKNKKTGQIVELKAFSSFHACNVIGWKPNKVIVLGEKDSSIPETSTLMK